MLNSNIIKKSAAWRDLKINNSNAFLTAQLSEAGGKPVNEDYSMWCEVNGIYCWVLADGLGAHGGGETASRLVCETIIAAFKETPGATTEHVKFYLHEANTVVLAAQADDVQLRKLQSTAVVLVSDGQKAVSGHVGDSRLYYLKDGKLEFQTEDHSVSQALVKAGELSSEEIRLHADRNRLLKSVGSEAQLTCDVHELSYELEKRDAILLCSDGLWQYIHERELEVIVKESGDPAKWLDTIKHFILARAIQEHDNYTGVAVLVTGLKEGL